MIDYEKVNRGDVLRLVGAGAPGYARPGDLLRVVGRTKNGVKVEDKRGETCEFVFNCGAARLEPTEWAGDFPADVAASTADTGGGAPVRGGRVGT